MEIALIRSHSPIKLCGGKGLIAGKLLPLIEQYRHLHYIEPFGGGAAILLAKRPSPIETYNDIDGLLVNFFRVLAAPDMFGEFYRRVSILPYSREIFNEARDTINDTSDPIERAVKYFILGTQNFAGRRGSWGYSISLSNNNMASTAASFVGKINMLPAIHSRLQRVQIEHRDWRDIITKYDTPQSMFYLDPPYLSIRDDKQPYDCIFGTDEHEDLIEALLQLQGAAILSGYDHPLYRRLTDAGWDKYSIAHVSRSQGCTRANGIIGTGALKSKAARQECIFIHPRIMRGVPRQAELFEGGEHCR